MHRATARLAKHGYHAIIGPTGRKRRDWVGLKGIVMVGSVRETIGGKTAQETRYHISSLCVDAERQGDADRSHWGVASHHRVMDMVFRDDECRARKDHGAENLALLRRICIDAFRAGGKKNTTRGKTMRAGWNDSYLYKLMVKMPKPCKLLGSATARRS